jgi:hypothetical protein
MIAETGCNEDDHNHGGHSDKLSAQWQKPEASSATLFFLNFKNIKVKNSRV